jgi:hypothetical protein
MALDAAVNAPDRERVFDSLNRKTFVDERDDLLDTHERLATVHRGRLQRLSEI